MGPLLSRAIVCSVSTVAAWRIDLLQPFEVELDYGLELISHRRAFEVRRQVVQPSAYSSCRWTRAATAAVQRDGREARRRVGGAGGSSFC